MQDRWWPEGRPRTADGGSNSGKDGKARPVGQSASRGPRAPSPLGPDVIPAWGSRDVSVAGQRRGAGRSGFDVSMPPPPDPWLLPGQNVVFRQIGVIAIRQGGERNLFHLARGHSFLEFPLDDIGPHSVESGNSRRRVDVSSREGFEYFGGLTFRYWPGPLVHPHDYPGQKL
jgi:hypothetical protein